MKDISTDKKPFTKSRLIKELSWTCELPQTKIKAILETLVEISRREARNTLVLPGICKLEVVRRKPRKVRNPRTGETFMLPERDALRITAPRSLKLACARVIEPAAAPEAPAPDASAAEVTAPATAAEPEVAAPVPVAVAEATSAEQPQPQATEQQPTAAEPTAEQPQAAPEAETPEAEAPQQEEPAEPLPPVDPNALISFRCPRCKQEVEATGDMVGFETECPTCGNPIKVPAQSEPGTIHGVAEDGSAPDGEAPVRHAQTVSSHEAESLSPEKLKGLTIRIDVDELGFGGQPKADEEPSSEQMVSFVCAACKQEIEASRDMVGETTACPNCGAPLVVPAESASNTLHDTSQEMDPKVIQAMKGRTMRIDMGEDF